MSLHTEWLRFGEGARLSGFYARPARATRELPSVIVLQEALGVNAQIERVACRIAEAGYAALAPDLYARDGERPPALRPERMVDLGRLFDALPGKLMDPAARAAAIATFPEPQRTELPESLQAVFSTLGSSENLEIVQAAAAYLRGEREETRGQRVATLGFCAGGGLAAQHACADPGLAGAVIFYGMSPPDEAVARGRCPIQGHYAKVDPRINGTLAAFSAAMDRAGRRFEEHHYVGAPHAFFNEDRASWNLRAARRALPRVLGFLGEVLDPL